MVIKNEMKYNGTVVLTYRIEYPQFRSLINQTVLGPINLYYMEMAMRYQQVCETELYNMAVQQYRQSIENNFPFHAYEALMVYKITLIHSCVISLYQDKYQYTGGAHGSTVRSSQTWLTTRGSMLRLRQLYTCPMDYQEYIFNEIIKEIQKDPSIYFDDYENLVKQTFNPRQFYCTPEGVVIYYQQYDIAPYASGIREFLLPYGKCIKNPATLCHGFI